MILSLKDRKSILNGSFSSNGQFSIVHKYLMNWEVFLQLNNHYRFGCFSYICYSKCVWSFWVQYKIYRSKIVYLVWCTPARLFRFYISSKIFLLHGKRTTMTVIQKLSTFNIIPKLMYLYVQCVDFVMCFWFIGFIILWMTWKVDLMMRQHSYH